MTALDTGDQRDNRNVILAKEDDSEADDEQDEYADFGEFWSEFRQAVEENDIQDILELTNFPFETRGEMDSDPIIKYSEKQMRKVMPLLLEQVVILPGKGTELHETTEAQIIINMKTVPAKDLQGESVRPGNSNFVFEKTKDGWKFVFAYVNEPTYEKIGK